MSEEVEFADEREAVIVDEFAEVDIADPTFGGMRDHAKLDEAYNRVVGALRELYTNRYQHSVPENAAEIYRELSEEIDLPYETEIGMLIERNHNEQKFSYEETEKLIKIVNKFVREASLLKD